MGWIKNNPILSTKYLDYDPVIYFDGAILRNKKAFTALSVHAFPPILSYDEWEAIAVPQQQKLIDETRYD